MITLICRFCMIPYQAKPYQASISKFCSMKCKGLAERTRVIANCQVCNQRFEHISSRCSRAKYCSTKCYNKAQSKKGSVEYECRHCHVKFMGSPSHKRIYCSKKCVGKASKSVWKGKYTTIRKNMLARGLINKCEKCGYTKNVSLLGVHHKDRNRENNDLSNLSVLCPTCHSEEHSKHITHAPLQGLTMG